jgi:hypothetical protein
MLFKCCLQESEKRVGFQEEDEHQYSDGENDKRPVSKLHRRDTPHHLKNKRVQQHLTDKSANLILSKLKEIPQPPPLNEVLPEDLQQVEMNPMPLVQDVGLPLPEEMLATTIEAVEPIDIDRNGIDGQQGKWK